MKKIILFTALVIASSSVFAADQGRPQFGIDGAKARNLYFALENKGAVMVTHTQRFTEYTLESLYCYSDTNIETKKTTFFCGF
jgi:hypothetical protein